jgi:15-cis-phytoene synthase
MADVPIPEDAAGHCEQLVRKADLDRFLATLFAPAVHRPSLFAIYAFNSEISRIRETAREPLPGEMRLQWWREVLAGERAEEARANPVSAALLDMLQRHNLPAQPLIDLLEARSFDLYDDPLPTLAHLEAYAEKTSSALFALAAQVLGGGRGRVAENLSVPAGVAYALTGLLRAFPWHAARRQLYVPMEILRRHGARPDDAFAAKATPELRMALAEMRLHARGHLSAANDFLAATPSSVLPAFLPVALVRPALKRMEQRGYDPFVPAEIPQWRRQWILWRAARRPRAMARLG